MSPLSSRLAPRWLIVFTVLLGTLTVSLNNTALNPAIPEFMDAFGIGAVAASWIITGFMISMGMTMPATAFLSHKFGKKTVYLSGLALFIGGSCIGALATSMPWVIAARSIQGVASGLMIPLSLALIFEVYPKDQRGKITGLWGMAVMLAPAVGPVVGGLLLQFFDWRALFVMNIPTGVIGGMIGIYCLPASSERTPQRFDWQGFVLVTLGIGVLLVTLSRLTDQAALTDPLNISLLIAALLCLTLFVRVELGKSHPLLSLRIFAIGSYCLSVVVVVAQSIGMFGSIVLLPLLMQTVLGYGAIWTGLALFATAVCASAFASLGGTLLDAKGPRGVVTTGLILSAVSTMAFGFINEHSSLWLIFALMMARGIGLGLSYIPVTTAGLNAIPEHLVTEGSAMNNILRRVTASVAIVLVSIYFEMRRTQLMSDGLASASASVTAINEIFVAIGLLILLTLPLALLLPKTDQYAKQQQAAAGSF
ncbi:MAG: DHA2 family efflux MFS transporter permease subunit [Gammaproteobacteria bacterium]|nr:DHA2 family efflux MFS transporter permease subunit [Gammaproteobacteria bacterium]